MVTVATTRPSVVWKFPLPNPICTVAMPADAQILSVAEQDGALVVWALCSPNAPITDRRLAAVNTGDVALSSADSRFIGTVQMQRSGVVWHVFEALSW